MGFWEGFCVFVYLDSAMSTARMVLVYLSSRGLSAVFLV